MRAEVLVFLFSGRENPSWFLSEEETISILKHIEALAPAGTDKTFRREGLGYRGFDMRWQSSQEATYSRLSTYMGLVLTGQSHLLLDPSRTSEKLLIESAHGRVDPAIEQVLQSALR